MQKFDRFHQTKPGLLLFGLVELALGYWAALWAIDSGNLLVYLLTVVLVIGGLHNLIKLALKLFRRTEAQR